jgi:3-oxoacyl-[acyl-carrier-protein] synthase-3
MKNFSNNIVRSVKITGTGSYAPERIVKNQELAERLTTTDEWIFDNLGIRERHIAADTEFTSDLAFEAAKKALENASLNAKDIDLIILATATPDRLAPSTACIVQEKLGAVNAAAFDVNAVCSGFLYAFAIGSQFIAAGMYQNVMIIGADTFSKITNWEDRSCVFFGDGAGAVVIGSSVDGWISCENNANGKDTGMTGFQLPIGGPFVMKGKEVWNQAIKVLPQSIKNILKISNTNINDVDMIVPHQPSINILKIIANELGFPMSKVKTVMDKYANIAGASIPIALDDAVKNGEIKKGDTIILTAVGSGWTWGSTILKWVK